MTTTTEQYAEQIRGLMTRNPAVDMPVAVLSLIRTAVAMGEGIDAVQRILAAEDVAMQMTFDALDATIAEVRAAHRESTR